MLGWQLTTTTLTNCSFVRRNKPCCLFNVVVVILVWLVKIGIGFRFVAGWCFAVELCFSAFIGYDDCNNSYLFHHN